MRIYAVQALNYGNMDFYRDMAKLTDGYHLNLDQFSSIADFMCAICFRERGMDELQVRTISQCCLSSLLRHINAILEPVN